MNTVSGRVASVSRAVALTASRLDRTSVVALVDAQPLGEEGVDLDEGFRHGGRELGDPSGLCPRLVVLEHPAGDEVDGGLGAHVVTRAAVVHRDEAGTAVRGGEAVGEEPRRPGVGGRSPAGQGQKSPSSASRRSWLRPL